ncbi:hypothetical protein EVAR_10379_1 [Eumeta japonica]|uniref:Mariner Mos1 transposase n=1 Tax=Eumeta variegata TaxID=151549 RepID=A0A4C1UCI2_EUMVA|nr:hypothetical protein EVAR_10379_1 [Eumeta japonica]
MGTTWPRVSIHSKIEYSRKKLMLCIWWDQTDGLLSHQNVSTSDYVSVAGAATALARQMIPDSVAHPAPGFDRVLSVFVSTHCPLYSPFRGPVFDNEPHLTIGSSLGSARSSYRDGILDYNSDPALHFKISLIFLSPYFLL